jgi:hypothetical protein
VRALVEILPFIQVIMVVMQKLYLQPAFHLLLEPFVETLHVHFVPLYVGEALFANEELADVAELLIVVPDFSSALHPIFLLCINQPL